MNTRRDRSATIAAKAMIASKNDLSFSLDKLVLVVVVVLMILGLLLTGRSGAARLASRA